MKKIFLPLLMVVFAGLMGFTLMQRKAEVERKMREIPQTIPTVATETVQKQNLQTNFTKVGVIESSNQVAVVSQNQGKVIAVYADVGSYLNAGAPFLKIDDETPRANLAAAEASYQKAQKDWQRAQELHQAQVISDSELESSRSNLRAAEANYTSARREYKNSYITAPISGVITDRPVNLGVTVTSGTTVATMVDNSLYKLKVNVGEQEAFQLKVGDAVAVVTDIYPGIQLRGRIKSISDQSDAAHTFPVEITLANTKDHPLKSGIFGRAVFQMGTANDVLTIPREALVGSIKTPQVYVLEQGKVKLRNIGVGSESNARLVVTEGLRENEQVVVSGQDNLSDNMAVKVSNQSDQTEPSDQPDQTERPNMPNSPNMENKVIK